MAEGLNRTALLGNLGEDPSLRFTQSNQAVLSLRMATSESYFDDKSKERKEHTEWHTVIVWGLQAEALNKILSKGSRIYVEGGNRTRQWADKQGNKRWSTEVKASKVILLGGGKDAAKRDRQEDGHASGGAEDSFGGGGHDDFGHGGDEAPTDDDIPFAYNESTAALVGIGKRII